MGAFSENLEDVLALVRETPRGRWFLEQYESRLKTQETTRILEAIGKLESHIQSISPNTADATLLQRARQAIANARRDIAALDQKPEGLSAEGQLFAKLAQLSRTSFAGDASMGQSVNRALTLVDELDRDLNTSSTPTLASANQVQFFKQDEALFEPAPAPKPVVFQPRQEAVVEHSTRGAKLVIQRVNATRLTQSSLHDAPLADANASVQAMPTYEPPALASGLVTHEASASQTSTDQPQSRIVIIRRTADEMESVPLFDMKPEEGAASAA